MTHGSLFTGIGGFDLAAERCGIELRWQCEIDPFCRAVLETHWPQVRRYGDITTVRALDYVDIISGGFPCQDISDNGACAGLDGEQSGLWRQMARAVRMVGPRYVVVENVAAMLHRGMGTVLGDLAALGYDAEWDCVSAADFGAPHARERVIIVARRRWTVVKFAADLPDCPDCGEPWCDECEDHYGECGCPGPHSTPDSGWHVREESGRLVAYPAGGGVEGDRPARESQSSASAGSLVLGCGDAGSGADHWHTEPGVARLVHGVPVRVDRVRALGNAVIPQIAQSVFTQILKAEQVNAMDRRAP